MECSIKSVTANHLQQFRRPHYAGTIQGWGLFNASERTDAGTIQGREVFEEIWYVQRLYLAS